MREMFLPVSGIIVSWPVTSTGHKSRFPGLDQREPVGPIADKFALGTVHRGRLSPGNFTIIKPDIFVSTGRLHE